MIRVRVMQPTIAHLQLFPGDVILQRKMTPELESFLRASRIDGERVCELLEDEEETAVVAPGPERAVSRGRR